MLRWSATKRKKTDCNTKSPAWYDVNRAKTRNSFNLVWLEGRRYSYNFYIFCRVVVPHIFDFNELFHDSLCLCAIIKIAAKSRLSDNFLHWPNKRIDPKLILPISIYLLLELTTRILNSNILFSSSTSLSSFLWTHYNFDQLFSRVLTSSAEYSTTGRISVKSSRVQK